MHIILLFFCILTPLMGEELFLSDSLANKYRSLTTAEGEEWVLGEDRSQDLTKIVLYRNQTEYKRWEEKSILESGQILHQELYYYQGTIRTLTIKNQRQQIQSETYYNSQGLFLSRYDYEYNSDGTITAIIQKDENSHIIEENEIIFRHDGSLRSLKGRENAVEWRSSDFENQYLETLIIDNNNVESRYDFSPSGLTNKQVFKDSDLMEESMFTYSDLGHLEKIERFEHENRLRVVEYYNQQGQLLIRNRYREEELEFSLVNTYKDSLLIRKQEKNSAARLIWTYDYSDTGALILTKQYRNGSLYKTIEIVDNMKIENLYRNGEEVLSRSLPLEDES